MTALRKHLSNKNMRSPDSRLDPDRQRYQKQRIAHWNRVSRQKENPRRPGTVYHKLLQHYYRFFIPPGLRRCAAQKHRRLFFIRCDAHEIPIKEKFDVIILSDLVNDLWDVQHVLDRLQPLTHRRTRVVLNFYNNLWRMPLGLAKRMGLGANMLEQNWFSPHDVSNLLELSGYEIIHHRPVILLPLRIPFVSNLANRYLVNFAPLSWFALTHFVIARSNNIRESSVSQTPPSVSVIVPARNEAGNIEEIIERVPDLGCDTELVFVEGHSSDNTYETIQQIIESNPGGKCKLFRQTGKGKGDAVRLGFKEATGDILLILDADMTVAPEDLVRFVEALSSGRGEFINGVRLVYPMEDAAMRFFNMVGNKFFGLAFSWLLGQAIKDTLCGTKILWKRDYELLARNRDYFGNFDPFGDFDLLFGAAKLNLKIVEVPIRYRSRRYGDTNISRWRHGAMLLKMVIFAAKRIKFI
jgi:hypothetical protein